MGLGYVLVGEALGRIPARRTAWLAFWLALAGSLAAAATVLAGRSTVLYTFYPPLQAHPLFYIGATLLVVGSWIWSPSLTPTRSRTCCRSIGSARRPSSRSEPSVRGPRAARLGLRESAAAQLLLREG